MTCFLCCPAQTHWTNITLLSREILWGFQEVYMWVENWIRCFRCVPTVNVPNCPGCLLFVPNPISAPGGDSFVIYFTLSYLCAIIVAGLPVSVGCSDLSTKASLFLEAQRCPGPSSLPACAAPASYHFWVLVLWDPPALVPAAKLYFPSGREFASRMFQDAYSENLWVYLNAWPLFLERALSLRGHEKVHSSSPLVFRPVVSESLHFFLLLNVWFLCHALHYVTLRDLQSVCFYLVVPLSHQFDAHFLVVFTILISIL